MDGYKEIEGMASSMNGKISKSEPLTDDQFEEILVRAENFKHLNPCQDYSESKVWYGVLVDGNKYLINSEGKLCPFADIVEGHKLPKNSYFSKSRISLECLRRFREGKPVNSRVLFARLQTYFEDHAVYKLKNTSAVLALWIMGTYVYQIFRWYGYLWFNSPSKRSGKSQSLELISHVAFNSTPVQTTPSLAYLFREVAANGSTICLDEVESLQGKDKDKYGEIMALLNVGFKRGATVGRCEMYRKEQVPVNFPAYCPKVFAGINSVIDTLEDRSFKIVMLKKKRSEKIKRFDLRRLEPQIKELLDDLYIFGLSYGPAIADLYDQEETLNVPERLDDRARDIFEPLFAIAGVIDREVQGNPVTEQLREFALDQAGIRESVEMDDNVTCQAVDALAGVDLGKEGKKILTPGELLDIFKGQSGLDEVNTKTKAGKLTSKLGLKSKSHWVDGKTIRGYLLTRENIDDLKERYLFPSDTNIPLENVRSVRLDGEKLENQSVRNDHLTDDFIDESNDGFSSEDEGNLTELTGFSEEVRRDEVHTD